MKYKTTVHLNTNIINTRIFYRIVTLMAATITVCHTGKAQFTIIDDLRGNNYPHIVVGGGDNPNDGTAYFTSGIDDPVGSGWLRLTKDSTNRKGYAYINRSFPSGMGVLVDFEYKMWRTRNDNNHGGADGICVFLFDANSPFRLGGYGGSLGYAPNTNSDPPVTEGLAGGYIGVGLDAYGNFSSPSNPDEGRNGGEGREPNSIVLRGPTINDPDLTNYYLAGTAAPGGSSVDYDNINITQRPSSDQFYRRVQITIMPIRDEDDNLKYEIAVQWSRTPGGAFEPLITYITDDPPPEEMKVGFAASTGSGFNYHEIRNILVTTLGNLRTVKLADRDYLIPDGASGGEDNKDITYTIEVVNDTDAPIKDILLRDTLKDAYGNTLTTGTFEITDIAIVPDPDVWITTPSSPTIGQTRPNIIEGKVSIAANSTGYIRVRGTLKLTPPGNHVVNTVKLHVPEGTDQDTLNNISHVRTPVYAEGVDLILGDIVPDGRCIDYVDGNTFMVQVSNLGTDDANLNDDENIVTVTITHPPGITLTPIDHLGWSESHVDTTYTFQLTTPSPPTLSRGFTHPQAIRFRLTPQLTDIPTRSAYTVSATVAQFNDEDDDNDENNTSTASLRNCAIISNPMIHQRVKWWNE